MKNFFKVSILTILICFAACFQISWDPSDTHWHYTDARNNSFDIYFSSDGHVVVQGSDWLQSNHNYWSVDFGVVRFTMYEVNANLIGEFNMDMEKAEGKGVDLSTNVQFFWEATRL